MTIVEFYIMSYYFSTLLPKIPDFVAVSISKLLNIYVIGFNEQI